MCGGETYMNFSAEVEGWDETKKQMQQLVSLAKERQLTQNALFYASQPMFEEIKQNAPKAEKAYFKYYRGSSKARLAGQPQNIRKLKRPGTLRRNVARKRIKVENGVGVGIYIKNKAFYFRFIELGTPHILAVPFIRPAYDKNKDLAITRFIERYREYIQKVIAKEQLSSLQEGDSDAG